MSETKYPLCARAGLKLMEHRAVIRAADVEKLLEGAPVVYGGPEGIREKWAYNQDGRPGFDTHTARLVMIEPIVKDTAESLLREFEKIFATSALGIGKDILERRISINDEGKAWDLLDRARRLLEGK